jgi:hypothetical protein
MRKMNNTGYRIITAPLILVSLFFAACPVENIKETYYDGKHGDFEWYFNERMVISKYTGAGGYVTIPAEIDGKPVKAIGDNAFYSRTSLTGITIPNSVTSIRSSAFQSTGLTSVVIPDSVTFIGDDAFRECKNLASITLPKGITAIQSETFYGCSVLGSVVIPDSVTRIGDRAFSGCNNLETINVSSGNKWYSSLDGVLYDKNFSTLFVYPKNREGNVTIPDGIKRIYSYAFDSCNNLTGITIPDSVTDIGNHVFSGCGSLETINVSPGNTRYSSLDGILYSKDFRALMVCPNGKVGTVTIPDSVTTIQSFAFDRCTGLTGITIPEGITSIEKNTFVSCQMLTGITLPVSITSIGNSAFWGCRNLFSITIPENVISIEANAFLLCDSLVSVTFAGDKIISPNLSEYSFNGDLRERYLSQGMGTYVRLTPGYTWTKLE